MSPPIRENAVQNDTKHVNWHQPAHDGTNEDQGDSHIQTSTHHEVSDVPSCSHIISFMVTRLDHTEGATQTHSPKQENPEVVETIYRSIFHLQSKRNHTLHNGD